MYRCRCHLKPIKAKEPIDPEKLQAFKAAFENMPRFDISEAVVIDAEPQWTVVVIHEPCPDCERVKNGG